MQTRSLGSCDKASPCVFFSQGRLCPPPLPQRSLIQRCGTFHSAASRLARRGVSRCVSRCVLQVVSLISELSQCCDTSGEEGEGGSGEGGGRPVLTLRLMKPFRCLCRARAGCTRRNCSENRPCTFAVSGKSVFMRVSIQGRKRRKRSCVRA